MRLIDADDLINNLIHFAPEHYTAMINMLIVKQPQVDAVEVIRCRNCEHHDDECLWCKKLRCETKNDCYCSLAKRRNCDD